MLTDDTIIDAYKALLDKRQFPCVAAKACLSRNHIKSIVIGNMASADYDTLILNFMYDFVDGYRASGDSFHSAAVIFRTPSDTDDISFDKLLWDRLKALSTLDKEKYEHDPRVDSDPSSPRYSYSLKSEAFFVIGLHPGSERNSRRFNFPTLVFNPHAEFEKLRTLHRYDKMKSIVRKRDKIYSGSVNPMLDDFGSSSEAIQYSGMRHEKTWKCPLKH